MTGAALTSGRHLSFRTLQIRVRFSTFTTFFPDKTLILLKSIDGPGNVEGNRSYEMNRTSLAMNEEQQKDNIDCARMMPATMLRPTSIVCSSVSIAYEFIEGLIAS